MPAHRASAQNASTTWAVQVESESRCSRDPDFAAELTAQIPEGQRAAPDEAELVARVRVQKVGKELVSTIRVIDRVLGSEAGARELKLPVADCATTADSLGLVLAVLVEAGRSAPTEPPPAEQVAPPPEPPPEEPEPSPPEPPRKSEPPRATRYAWQGPRAGHDVHLGIGGGFGLLPDLYAGAHLGWGLRVHGAWPVWLEVNAFLPRATRDGKAEFSSVYGGVYPCPLRAEQGRFRGRICPGFAAGYLRAAGQGFLEARTSTQVVATLGLDASGDVQLWGPLTAFLRVRAEVPLLRERFVYYQVDGGTPELHQATPVTLVAFLGMGLRFR